MGEPSPVVLHWRLPVSATVETAWEVVSDTDRFNRAMGLGIQFTETLRDDGTVERRAEMRRFGVRITWEEQPFQFRAPEWFRHERTYDNGPVMRSWVECRVEPTDDGAVIDYRLNLVPSRSLLRPVVLAEARLSTQGEFDRVFEQMVAAIEGRPNTYDPQPGKLTDHARDALTAGLADIEPAPLAEALIAHIEEAPLHEQARLRPLAFAQRLHIPEDAAIQGFLQAVRNGALELSWELLCPSCLAPKEGRAQLDINAGEVHCPTCNIRYDSSFPDSVDVVFRPASHLREVEVAVACLLSPARTPHVVAQEELAAEQDLDWNLFLPVGGFRLQTDPGFGTASIEVRQGVKSRRITVDLTARGIRPAVLRVAPGPVRITLRNRLDRPLQAHLERAYRPPHTLTAGRLFEIPGTRDLLPPESVAPGLDIAVRNGWVLAMSHVTLAEQSSGSTSALWDEPSGVVGNGVLLQVYDQLDALLEAAEVHDGDPEIAVGIAGGPVVWMEQGDEHLPSGRSVDRALEIMRAVGGGHLGVAADSADEVAACLGERGRVEKSGVGGNAFLRFSSAADRRAQALAEQREAADPLPERIDAYEIISELGRGGMGRVLEATDPSGTPVVVKVLLPALARDPDNAQRFYNEAYVTAGLDHPNIVKVYDYGTTEKGETYMVMERLDGHELEEFVQAGTLSADRVQHVGVQLLDALQVAHDAGIVHRDVKPANVFILEDGHVKVIDFGIAHPIDKDDELAERGVILGSPRYMAPEQVARDPLDGRADLYSAALVMYECLTQESPFDGDNAYSLALARLNVEPRPLSDRCDPLPDGFEGVLMRALELDPPRRWPTAAEMADALAAIECT